MSTNNFDFDHRCIVVTNEDYDDGNIPKLGDYRKGALRSYPSRLIEECNFKYFDVALTSGYYDAACIDYYDKEEPDSVESMLYYFYFTNKDALFAKINDYGYFNISREKFDELTKAITEDSEYWYDECAEVLDEYFKDKEEEKINEYLDHLKTEYGYQEYRCIGRFSNGEALYESIAE